MKIEDATLTLEQLSAEVNELLNKYALMGAQQDHRVSAAPDARTIRYYTTLGLLDRPRIDGRQGRYGRRHVLQILAIKTLQAINLPLSEIQNRLYGRTDGELESILASLAEFWKKQKTDNVSAIRATHWREIVIQPGVKLMIEEGWAPSDEERSQTMQKLEAVLDALLPRSKTSNEGDFYV